ncbi:flagellar basal body P-ring formation chaperone FlgA [Variovorax arabinosiphilus]|uniref:flagellar basal body P-ring formation chaperone FlgA n=1 Tax=Variovorax arabinosiphilus TaxID=3053498 RepID=UPI002576D794|nr:MULTISPECIES: flagellar basal body P-ring formation chaperone FlgA [unclassified Variovorax]MDM0122184.1 flagellar basal body P-ring formation chaperone FlgA [Variovorax sp. J2L1-78]MDM0131287.1 flagellar basal body P-ring formation chaperone FlgA [Variovorax sp. J2L1-63]MDM0234947.1 flagellar basal body P-ring formation chaperone FlgA [Variovorax sp. J2R1-6]
MAFVARAMAPLGALVFAALAPFAEAQTVGQEVRIELKANVAISGPDVRLGDIAFLTTRDLPLMRRLIALPMGPAPRPGAEMWLDREAIEQWVLAKSGLRTLSYLSSRDVPTLRWSGPQGIRLESAAQQLSGDVLTDAGRASLVQQLSTQGVRAEVRPVGGMRDLVLPAGTATLRVRQLPEGSLPSNRMVVWVDVWVADRFVRTVPVSFEVAVWAYRSVATVPLSAGAPLDAVVRQGGMHAEEIDIARARPSVKSASSATIDDTSVAQDRRLKRPVRPGEVVANGHLETAPTVARGHWARLLARSGDVSVESRVEVLQDGRQGQLVRVKVPGSRGEVLARVVGQGEVELQP